MDDLKELEEFEEVEKIGMPPQVSEAQQGQEGQEGQKKGNRPDYRILQPDTDPAGKSILRNVGAMWKSSTRDGREFYVLKIGELRLLVFPNR